MMECKMVQRGDFKNGVKDDLVVKRFQLDPLVGA